MSKKKIYIKKKNYFKVKEEIFNLFKKIKTRIYKHPNETSIFNYLTVLTFKICFYLKLNFSFFFTSLLNK